MQTERPTRPAPPPRRPRPPREADDDHGRLSDLDHAHVWHPFTPMRQWCERPPLVIERGEGPYLFDTEGNRYLDGVSSLWCNVHGHRAAAIDDAVRRQLDRVAHTTLLGLASPPSIELAERLVRRVGAELGPGDGGGGLQKVFYSDAGATALEVAFKMAVGYWHHRGRPEKTRFVGLAGAYHGDTVGAMSVGFSDLFHRPFAPMAFPVDWFPAPDALRPPEGFASAGRAPDTSADRSLWPSEDAALNEALSGHCLDALRAILEKQADQTAAVVIEPVMQGAAGMVCQPPGFVRRVAELARRHNVLLIADEVAVGFGRTGEMFACGHDGVRPDLLCLAKGLTGGYLPLAVTMATDEIYDAFTGTPDQRRTLYHGHTYTGNPLACAAALASLELFDRPVGDRPDLLTHVRRSAELIRRGLDPLRGCPHVRDVRQRGVMVGIELDPTGGSGNRPGAFDFAAPNGRAVCDLLRQEGVIIRPLGDVVVLMPIPATPHDLIEELTRKVVAAIAGA
ncbi:MAG: adenosylmethionine--8-amino-7-oxononanoate transaminase [Planctomycetota bacterium]